MNLNDLNTGDCAIITTLNTEGNMRRRLLDIGLTSGTRVECVGRSVLDDPIAFLIRGAVIAIRSEDCANILIRKF